MRIVVIGGSGQLGRELVSVFERNGCDLTALGHGDVELADIDSVCRPLHALYPDVVVNTAAMHHVEECERDPDRAFAVNAQGARNLALLCAELGSVLIQISTDYVFDGLKKSPYLENDDPNPLNAYGRSKLRGEEFVREIAPRSFVVRTSALYGAHPCRGKGGLNFVQLMLKLGREREEVRVVDSERVTPTPVAELARHVADLTRCDGFGVYHATSEGSCSWYEFAREIFTVAKIRTRLVTAGAGEFLAKVPRPLYSVLENRGLKQAGMNHFHTWQEGLARYLGEIRES